MSWKYVEAGELMAKRSGTVDPSKFPDEVFELHSIPAFDAGRPDMVSGREIGSAKQVVQPDDVMISKIVPHIRRASVVGPSSGYRQIASGEWIVFRDRRLFPSYLRHLLMSDDFNAEFMATVSGVGGSLLRARPAEVAKIKIPLPPIEEQCRIAAILDKADALRAKRREFIAKFDQLSQSVFFDMFGDPVENPKGCEPAMLGDLVEEMQYGPRFYNERYSENGTRIVRITDLDSTGELDFDAMPRMDVTKDDVAQYGLQSGDLIFARTGATVGKVALIKESSPPCIAGAYFIRMRFKSAVLPEYVFGVLRAKSIQELIAVKSRQAAQQNFSGPGLRALPVPIPLIDLQSRFAEIVEKIQVRKRKMQGSQRQMDQLFGALQRMAFSGGI